MKAIVRARAVVVALALMVVPAAACGSSSPSASTTSTTSKPLTKSTLTIGIVENNVSTLTGGKIPDFPDTVNAWTTWVNSHGGINGHPVNVIQENDNNDAAQAVTAATTLANNPKVLAIIDADTYDNDWAKVVDQAKVPVICGSGAGDGFTCQADANFFPAGATVLTSIWGQSKAAALAGAKVYGLVNCTLPACAPAAPLEKQYAQENGLQYGYQVTANPTSPNFTAQCLGAKNAHVDALFAVVPIRIASDCAQQGYNPIWIQSQGAYNAAVRTDTAYKVVTGDVGNFPWFLDTNAATHTFREAMKNYWPNFDSFGTPYNAVSTWAALQMFAAAAAHVSATPTRQDIYNGIYAFPANFTLGGLMPPETITQGKPTQNNCVYIVNIKNQQYKAPYGLKTFCQKTTSSGS